MLLEFIDSCCRCESREELDRLVEALGFLAAEHSGTALVQYERSCPESTVVLHDEEHISHLASAYAEKGYRDSGAGLRGHLMDFGSLSRRDTYLKTPIDGCNTASMEDFSLLQGWAHGAFDSIVDMADLVKSSCGDRLEERRAETIIRMLMPHIRGVMERVGKKERQDRLQTLTDREKEVLKWQARGKTAWETAVILDISERTVRFHVDSIMQKLDAVNKSHAIAVALDLGIIVLG